MMILTIKRNTTEYTEYDGLGIMNFRMKITI